MKARTNFKLDMGIAVAFLVSMISGIVLWVVLPHGGFQGGRNPLYSASFLFLSRSAWDSLHVWSSVAMGLGVMGHLALHWKWLTCMTRKLVIRDHPARDAGRECPLPVA
jgi:hypothetical protein